MNVKRYFFQLNEQSQAVNGVEVIYPAEYTVEGTAEVMANQERAFYIDGEWIIYDRLTIAKSSDEPISVSDEITVTATLPADSPDNEVVFTALFNGRPLAEPVDVAVTDGQAVQAYIFDKPGYYTVSASSTHHGGAATVIVVKEAEA